MPVLTGRVLAAQVGAQAAGDGGRPIALVGLSFHKGQRELQGVAYELLPSEA